MPFINVKTNVSVSAEQKTSIKSAMGRAITAIPGKSEGWLMVGIEPDYDLWFKGEDAPAAMVEVSIFGNASSNALTTLTSHITGILTDNIGDLFSASDHLKAHTSISNEDGYTVYQIDVDITMPFFDVPLYNWVKHFFDKVYTAAE